MNMLLKANLMHPHGRKFSKIGFIRFQTSLYDSNKDLLAMIFPPKSELTGKYKNPNTIALPYYWVMYILDMVGIRKSKKE